MDSSKKGTKKNLPLIGSVAFHAILIGFLIFTFERTIIVPPTPGNAENKEIIDAVMINKESLQKEVARLDAIEKRKKAEELERKQEIVRKENEAKLKRQKEEELLVQLKAKNEKLKKEAEQLKIAKVKEEKERKEKLKTEKALLEKQKLKKEKEAEAALAKAKDDENVAQKKAEVDQEAAQNPKVNQDAIMQHAAIIKEAIMQKWRIPTGMDIKGLKCTVIITLMPTGEVLGIKMINTSGSLEFDRSGELAVQKASPLPMPNDAVLAREFKQVKFTFDPEAV